MSCTALSSSIAIAAALPLLFVMFAIDSDNQIFILMVIALFLRQKSCSLFSFNWWKDDEDSSYKAWLIVHLTMFENTSQAIIYLRFISNIIVEEIFLVGGDEMVNRV